MKILISGAAGFVGAPLCSHLKSLNHTVVPLIRNTTPNLEGFDAVIHLAGESLIGRWTESKKNLIRSSRVEGTAVLVKGLSLLKRPPMTFISASAVGYYGDRGEEHLDEGSAPGAGFLSSVCRQWEEASRPLEDLGVRVVHARFGVVLDREGGMLKTLLPIYRLGLGGKLGSGKQWLSWIARVDLIYAIDHILHHESLRGPANLVSPNALRQEEFVRTLASLLHRPALLRLPACLLRLILGDMADEMLLASAKVQPTKLLESAFTFQKPKLIDALL